MHSIGEVLADRDDQGDLAVVVRDQQHDPAPEPVAQGVGEAAQRRLLEAGDPPRDEPGVADGHGVVPLRFARPAERGLHLHLVELAGQPPGLGLQPPDRVHRAVAGDAQRREDGGRGPALFLHVADGGFAGDRLDAAHPGRDAGLLSHREQADVAGGPAVGAAAQLHADAGHRDDPHRVAVLLAEQGHGAGVDGFLGLPYLGLHGVVRIHAGVDLALDRVQRLGADRSAVGEVEPQPVGRDERAGLLDVRAEALAEGGVEQMGRRVVAADGVAALPVHVRRHPVAFPQASPRDPHPVRARSPGGGPLQAVDLCGHRAAAGRQPPGVRDLAAGFEVERRPIEHRVARRPGVEGGRRGASVVEQPHDLRPVDPGGRVALEPVGGGKDRRAVGVRLDREPVRPGFSEPRLRPRLRALRLQAPLEAVAVDGDAAFAGQLVDEVQGQAVGVVQAEDLVPGQDAAGGPGQRRLEAGEAVGQDRVEPVLFGPHHPGDRLAVGAELGVRDAHLADHDVDEAMEERAGHAQLLPVPHRAAHDLAQHVAAPLVGGHDAVAHEEGHRAQVVGDDPHRDVVGPGRASGRQRAVGAAGLLADGAQQRREQVGVVVRGLLLDDRDDPLQAHARVDGRRGQRGQRAVRAAVELHEHVVPDFDVAFAAAVDAPARRLPAVDVVSAVIVDLGAPAAGPGVAHRPEVVFEAQLDDAPGGDEAAPDGVRLVVAGYARLALEHGRVQPLRRQPPHVGQQRPREGDGVFLEVVPEREVPEHLEERVVAPGGAHVVEVVVLAADPHAFLRRRRPLVVAALAAEEQVFELVHARVGEEQRRVVGRHERRAADDAMALAGEVVEEALADRAGRHAAILP